jgi:uncharacterized protein YndB with AHSA1/START domain
MSTTIAAAPVRKSIRVNASRERAFDAFARNMIAWWNREHTINPGSPMADVVIEPRVGGRWFERGKDGSECQWGKVLAWEPPGRLLLAWQLTPQWTYDPNQVTELEVRFIADGDGTRVELEHRLDGFGEAADEMFRSFDSPTGWMGLLELYAKAV